MNDKIENGVFYTTGNPFDNTAFKAWAGESGLKKHCVLEPFAGANHLIGHLQSMGDCQKFASYDLLPSHADVIKRDTLADFPTGYEVCVTNPPWLAKNRATRFGWAFPETYYDDLYKLSLEKCLTHCGWVAAIVPESFIRADLFQERLTDFVSLTGRMFDDTDHPVGLALFTPYLSTNFTVWRDSKELGLFSDIEAKKPREGQKKSPEIGVRFNDPDGNLGLIAIDNTRAASIRFCDVSELADYSVKHSSRSITKIMVEGCLKIKKWNDWLKDFREETGDVLLTSFKGRRSDGAYRRRLDFDCARKIINHV